MAKFLGESGRFVSQEAIRKFRRRNKVALIACSFLGVIIGFTLSLGFDVHGVPPILAWGVILFSVALAIAVGKVAERRMIAFEKERVSMRKGAVGEAVIALILRDFPDDFMVINGLKTPHGDLDHVVIGPTGVYVLDTKNWKGVVKADGHGELLLNGNPTDKPEVGRFVQRMMDIRKQVTVLAGFESYFNAVLAFPSARVEARWGTTGAAHCVTDEQLWDYIVENKKGENLNKGQIDRIAQAFAAVATMDKSFKREPVDSDSNA